MIFLETTENGWNCNLQGADNPYFSPFTTGDSIPMQLVTPKMPFLAFNDTDFITTSQSGIISVTLVDSDTLNPILGYVDLFGTTYHVGAEQVNGFAVQYLTLIVDTNFIPINIDCFRVSIDIGKIQKNWISEPFQRVKCDEKSVLLQSSYNKYGCDNFLYGIPSNYTGLQTISYQPYIRLLADWQYTGTTAETTENDNGKVTRQVLHDKYNLYLLELLPPYIAERLRAVVFGNNTQVTANGTIYNNINLSSDFQKNNDENRTFNPEITFSKRCVLKRINCI
jgi:hypothetical protein